MSQITTATFFSLNGISNKWWAFKQIQLARNSLKKVEGLVFSKLLGSGAKNGFSTIPNFGVYVLLCIWESEEKANSFFNKNDYFNTYTSKCKEYFTAFLHSAEVHGKWDGIQPFIPTTKLSSDKSVMVLTRATIRTTKLLSFWSKVGKVSESLDNYNGVLISIGVGELPLIQQATLSIWKTQAEMMDYAYKNKKHKEVILLTRKFNWYKEEMFARFVPYKFQGIWNGKSVDNLIHE